MLGRNLGNYHVVSKIGEGGMGAVYLARHVTLGRPAAIKVLHPSLSSNQDMVSRFFNEARAATAVRNPGIVEVFDFGVDEQSAYIVMEYLEGENLGARIRRGRMSVAATMTIIRAISRALHAAHEQGIVHRDLKPDNVFLVPDPELPSGERVKLLDFGIAKLAPVAGEASQTRTGVVMGTPTYMAPEQCRGAGAVDHRADLYALGCVAYQMLCGQPPFVSDGAGDLIARHLYFPPEPLRSRYPEIPAQVDDLVLWLLQKEPAARPASAADLIRAIEGLATGSEAGALQTQPPIRSSAAGFMPPVDTTLQGAASTVALTGVAPRPQHTGVRRGLPTGLIVGVAAGAVAAAVMFVVVRGRHGDEVAPAAQAALVVPGDRGPAVPPPAALATPPALPPAAPVVTAPPAPVAPEVPQAAPASPSAQPASPAETVAAAPPARPTAVDRPERSSRTDRKKHPPSARVALHDPAPVSPPAPAPAAAAEPPPPAPAPPPSPPPSPQVAQPVSEPPPAEPPRAVPRPPAAPAHAAPKATPLVPAAAVTKRSGAIPAIKVNGASIGEFADVVVKLCIDEQGAVSSVKVVKAPPEIAGELQRGLQSWRYAPYINPAGVQSAACFPVSFRVVLKG